jgi:subtilisin family serine protease
MLLLLGLLALVAGDLAPLLPHKTTIDRVVDGVAEREYITIFNNMAPRYGDRETLVNWASQQGVKPDNVLHYYSIGSFQGFGAWLTEANLLQIRSQSIVQFVEEDEVVSLDFTTEPYSQPPYQTEPGLLGAVTVVPTDPTWRARLDWGQKRVNSRAWNLHTINTTTKDPVANGYRQTSPALYNYPYAAGNNAFTSQWDYADTSFQVPSRGKDAVVWVVDTGVRVNHVEFAGSPGSRVTFSINFVAQGGVENTTDDLNGHGTHCAGTAAGNYRGVAPDAEIRSVRVLNSGGSGTWDAVIAGFNHVANNQVHGKANIMSISLGGGATESVDQALNHASNAGVISVVAAGNSNNNACGTGGVGGNSPARAAQAITVVATSSDDWVASFSSYGPCCKSCAPGVTITSAWIAPTGSTATNYYNDISGTSMATPHVAGAIAVHVSTPGIPWDPDSVKADLDLDQTNGVVQGLTGVKQPTPNKFLYSQWKYQ